MIIQDFSFALIREFLEEVGSDLRKDAAKMPMEELVLQMRIANGPSETWLPLNVGLLFLEDPTRFFPGASTDVVIYPDNSGRSFTEKTFKDSIHYQIRRILDFFKSNTIKEKVKKSSAKAGIPWILKYT